MEPGHPCEEPLQPPAMAAGLIPQPVHRRTRGSAVQRKTCCCWGHRVTTTLKTKVGLNTMKCLLSPDVSPESCKSRRRPQVGTCSVATYSWAEGSGVTRATTALPGRATGEAQREPQPHPSGRCAYVGHAHAGKGLWGNQGDYSPVIISCKESPASSM